MSADWRVRAAAVEALWAAPDGDGPDRPARRVTLPRHDRDFEIALLSGLGDSDVRARRLAATALAVSRATAPPAG